MKKPSEKLSIIYGPETPNYALLNEQQRSKSVPATGKPGRKPKTPQATIKPSEPK
jgi:hypothetical protein